MNLENMEISFPVSIRLAHPWGQIKKMSRGPVILKTFILRTFLKPVKSGHLGQAMEAMRFLAKNVLHFESLPRWRGLKAG